MSNFISVNPNASDEVVNVLNYFKSICGKGILSGQHDGSISGSQFDDIKKITGISKSIDENTFEYSGKNE